MRKICWLRNRLSLGDEFGMDNSWSPGVRTSEDLVNFSDDSSCQWDGVFVVIKASENKSSF